VEITTKRVHPAVEAVIKATRLLAPPIKEVNQIMVNKPVENHLSPNKKNRINRLTGTGAQAEKNNLVSILQKPS
jgi:hypothetical protein